MVRQSGVISAGLASASIRTDGGKMETEGREKDKSQCHLKPLLKPAIIFFFFGHLGTVETSWSHVSSHLMNV